MFSDEFLSKIYSNPDLVDIPIIYLILVTHAIEKILEENGYDF